MQKLKQLEFTNFYVIFEDRRKPNAKCLFGLIPARTVLKKIVLLANRVWFSGLNYKVVLQFFSYIG